jgi:hypothetical protein
MHRQAFKTLPRGSAVTIFTPDDTHFTIAMAAVNAGMHVLIAKPLVKTLKEHHELLAAARANNVLCVVEVHKRFDPFYTDARDRIASLGDFSYMVRAWPGGHVHPLFSFPRVPVSVKPQTSLFCVFVFSSSVLPRLRLLLSHPVPPAPCRH